MVDLVISLVEQEGELFHVVAVSVNESHACALTVKAEVPVTLNLSSDSNAFVGVIAAGNGSSDRSKSIKILDSPVPVDEIPSVR